MSSYTPIAHLKQGNKYNQTFLVQSISARTSKNKPYIIFDFKDVSGSIRCFLWNRKIESLGPIRSGSYVSASVKVELYRDSLNLTTQNIVPVKRPENIQDYIGGESDHVLSVYHSELQEILSTIDDIDIRHLIDLSVEHHNLIDGLKNHAYAEYGKYSQRGGLLVHTALSCKVANSIINALDDEIDRNIVIPSIIIRHWARTQTLEQIGDVWVPNEYERCLGVDWAAGQIARDLLIDVESTHKKSIDTDKKIILQAICSKNVLSTREAKLVQLVEEIC